MGTGEDDSSWGIEDVFEIFEEKIKGLNTKRRNTIGQKTDFLKGQYMQSSETAGW
ncbi:MAG: hypothetical protein NPIRA05_11260 [Nitrospirales bacterium]|nr:MAG: hypothetical protein NPIRA05_11260 [Nitrospirales bacterium]